LNGRNAPVAS
jgi:hypothetical protein